MAAGYLAQRVAADHRAGMAVQRSSKPWTSLVALSSTRHLPVGLPACSRTSPAVPHPAMLAHAQPYQGVGMALAQHTAATLGQRKGGVTPPLMDFPANNSS
jgi:hypothetical protein